jgi:acyl carrier protein
MQDAKAIVRRFLLDTIVMAGHVEIADETSFMDDHILDSTGFIELITFVEETFGVTVDDEEMLPENFDSLRNIDAYLARKRAARAVA